MCANDGVIRGEVPHRRTTMADTMVRRCTLRLPFTPFVDVITRVGCMLRSVSDRVLPCSNQARRRGCELACQPKHAVRQSTRLLYVCLSFHCCAVPAPNSVWSLVLLGWPVAMGMGASNTGTLYRNGRPTRSSPSLGTGWPTTKDANLF